MKKTLIALVALSGLAMGADQLTFMGTINLSEGVLTGVTGGTVNVDGFDFQSAFNLTLTSSTGAFTSGTTGYTMSDADTTTMNGNVNALSGAIYNIANTQSSWVGCSSKGSGTSLTLTITGLEAGATYNVSLLSGIDWEQSGSWNDMTTTNTYDKSLVRALGAEKVPASAMGAWALTGVVADEQGQITFVNSAPNVAASGWHTPVFNGVSVAKVVTTPEPATATLSLLALAGLASRRRRH